MRVFVTTGTDHHPFNRLVGWVANWLADNPDNEVVLQHGPAPPIASAVNHTMLTMEQMGSELSAADVVVVSGGPGAVMSARAEARKPIAVPREAGEAVDDHQLAFVSLISKRGLCHGATTEDEFRRLMEIAEQDPEAFRCDPPEEAVPDAVEGLRSVIDGLRSPR